jgi:hypothetical protein
MKEHTKLNLFLSNGTIVTIYYEGSYDDIGEGLGNDIEESCAMKIPFLTSNYEVSQMVIKDGSGNLMFSGTVEDEPLLIDIHKVIGWTVEE